MDIFSLALFCKDPSVWSQQTPVTFWVHWWVSPVHEKKSTVLKEVRNGGREELQVSAPPEGWWGDLLCSLVRNSSIPGMLMEKTFPVPSMRTSVGQKCLEWTQRGQFQMEFLTCFIPPVPVCDSPEWCPGTATRMGTGIHTGPFSLFSREAALSQLSQCRLSYCSLATTSPKLCLWTKILA